MLRTRKRHAVGGGKKSAFSVECLETRLMLTGPGEDNSGTEPLEFEKFTSDGELREFLIQDALETWGDQFGQPTWWGPYYPMPYADVAFGAPASPGRADGAAEATLDHSETNTQVAGVDEADLVETDGAYLYILSGQELVIADSGMSLTAGNERTVDSLGVVSRVEIDGQPFGQYLSGDRLTVISQSQGPFYGIPEPRFMGPAFDTEFYPEPNYEPQVTVTVLDVSDRSAPSLVQETSIDGTYVDSRAIGQHVYVVTSDNFGLPAPQIICDSTFHGDEILPPDPWLVGPMPDDLLDVEPFWIPPPDPQYQCVYETRDEYLDRVTENVFDLALPHYEGYDADGDLVESGLLSDAEDVYKPILPDDTNLITVAVFDNLGQDVGPASTTSVPSTYTTEMYASTNSLYLLNPDWGSSWQRGPETSIFQLDMEGADVSLAAFGEVPGTVLNSFSIDEYDDHLRIATSQRGGRETDNRVFVLKESEDSNRLNIVGTSESLARGEQIFAVRFMEETGYVVTFLRTDPLFTLDLSTPEKPTVVGELHIPGFSNYLHPVGKTHLIGIGNAADEKTGRVTGLQVSLFDVTNRAEPTQADRYSFDLPGWASTEANYDHHAVGYYPEQGILAIPITNGGGWIQVDRDGDGAEEFGTYRPRTELWVFEIDTNDSGSIELLGQIEHDAEVRRSVRIEDLLYSISQHSVKVHPILEPKTELASLHFGQENVGVPVFEADPEDARVRLAVETPERAAPQIVDVNVGSTAWAGEFVNHLESQATTNNSLSPLEIVPHGGVDQIKVTFSEDVFVGWTDLTVRGDTGGDYPILNFSYNPETSTAVWTLSKPLAADTVSVQVHDAVGDLARNALDGDTDTRAGGSFVYQFQVLPGDANQDGQVDRSDIIRAMTQSSRELGDAGYSFTSDIDGNGVIDSVVLAAIGAQTGTALPVSVNPNLMPGDSNGDGHFDQRDIVKVLQSGKYVSGEPATWEQGDWNHDGRFDQLDLITALQENRYAHDGQPDEVIDRLFEEIEGADEF